MRTRAARFTRILSRLTDRRFLPVLGTLLTLVIMLILGQIFFSTRRGGFISMPLFSNLLVDNSYLLLLAVGMTFVILTGGIDLSVGAVVALVGLVIARLLTSGVPLIPTLILAVLIGTSCGVLIGVMVQVFGIQPFIASLAVMFLARGLANIVSVISIGITIPANGRTDLYPGQAQFAALASWSIKFGEGRGIWRITAPMIIAFTVITIAFLVLHYTRFGRTVYGLGQGDGGTAVQRMGLRPDISKITVYAVSGTCAGIAGLLFALYTRSGYCLSGLGMELDAIAAVVIGGTLLAGGSGFVLGSVCGVFVYGLIQVLNARWGLQSWWAKVFIGAVLLVFVLLQRALTIQRTRRKQAALVMADAIDPEFR
ncbi:MAG: sugar ABC transporter permease YjfF [Propionibacteriaceae bacterium]|jgi:simple sugar transport system permease protein|nr:sugar ABC transporter permease YjfF [Propionibacteriaceae bacterium]